MAESGVAAAAARRGTKSAVAKRLLRVQAILGTQAGRAAGVGGARSARFKQVTKRFAKANKAAENTLNARGGGGGRKKPGIVRRVARRIGAGVKGLLGA